MENIPTKHFRDQMVIANCCKILNCQNQTPKIQIPSNPFLFRHLNIPSRDDS